MHPGNSGLSGGAFTLTTITRDGEKGEGKKKRKKKKEKKKRKKERRKREERKEINGRLPRLSFYIDSLCIRECNCKALCRAIHHLLYIDHTRS
jgi:hypothetical protein